MTPVYNTDLRRRTKARPSDLTTTKQLDNDDDKYAKARRQGKSIPSRPAMHVVHSKSGVAAIREDDPSAFSRYSPGEPAAEAMVKGNLGLCLKFCWQEYIDLFSLKELDDLDACLEENARRAIMNKKAKKKREEAKKRREKAKRKHEEAVRKFLYTRAMSRAYLAEIKERELRDVTLPVFCRVGSS